MTTPAVASAAGPTQTPLFIELRPDSEAPLRQRFVLLHQPAAQPVRGLVLYLHPWAEEMNKSRRMAALQARALAAAGFAVLQPDLLGCGDSDGDFADANWQQWLQDGQAAAAWLQQRLGQHLPLWLWGLRLGGLLATQLANRLPRCDGLLLWQPSSSGKQVLQQFLRLKTAGQLASGQTRPAGDPVRQQLAAGQVVDIAGYRLSPAMASGLEAATLSAPERPCAVLWLELSQAEPPALGPATQAAVARWHAAGVAVQAQAVPGPAFWQTVEIEQAPALVAASTQALLQAGLARPAESAHPEAAT